MVSGLCCNLVLGYEVVVFWFVVGCQPVYYLLVEVVCNIGDLIRNNKGIKFVSGEKNARLVHLQKYFQPSFTVIFNNKGALKIKSLKSKSSVSEKCTGSRGMSLE